MKDRAMTGKPPHETPGAGAYVTGVTSALIAVSIWGTWIVATRYAVTTRFDPVTVGLLRFAVPALVFLPLWWRAGLLPAGVPRFWLFAVVAGCGTPFFLVAASGMSLAPAAHFGALGPGTMPFFVALFAYLLDGTRPTRFQVAGIAAILVGVAGIGGFAALTSGGDLWKGHLLMLLASMLWSLYSVAFPRTGVDPKTMAGLVGVWSFLLLLPLWPLVGFETFAHAPAFDLAIQVFMQGFMASAVAIVAYGMAMHRLGAPRAAAFSSLVPAIATLCAIPVLGEWPGWVALGSVVVISFGVLLTSGVFERDRL